MERAVPLPVDVVLNTSLMQDGSTQLTPKFAVINITATGTLVAAVTSKIIRVLSLFMTIDEGAGDEIYTFKSGAGGTALTGGLFTGGISTPVLQIVLPFNPVGWFETASGSLLELSLAGSTPVADGALTYLEV